MKKIILFIILVTGNLSAQTQPAKPTGFKGIGYELHIDLIWSANTETTITTYKIYKWDDASSSYVSYALVPKTLTYQSIWIGETGLTFKFKLSAVDQSGLESPLSDSVVVTTHTMTDDEFLDMVQRATFRYFWDYGDPNSGLARERYDGGRDLTNTIGGSGFGVMAIVVGIERNFITRGEGIQRMLRILNFLANTAQKFYGAFPHWLNGSNGQVVKFGVQDGGDIVETSFMIEGLLVAKQYFNRNTIDEKQIVSLIDQIYNGIDWNFYKNNSTTLKWNWSPTMGFNFGDAIAVRGWNETLITYLVAIAAPGNAIQADLYAQGWADNGSIVNGSIMYGRKIYVGSSYGGPLFFSHYSFMGFDPRGLKDSFGTNYFLQGRNATLVHREYAIRGLGFPNYNANVWGLTASYDIPGVEYNSHAPNEFDDGTIAPTASLSSMPYTPTESIAAMKYLYRTYKDKLWGRFGFYDAFNTTYSSKSGNTWNRGEWFSNGYLAIDEGPIINMIENYRSQLLWNLFMSNPEIQSALDRMGFVRDLTSVKNASKLPDDFVLNGNYPNPFNSGTVINFIVPKTERVSVVVYNLLGQKIKSLFDEEALPGEKSVSWNGNNESGDSVSSGVYIYRISAGGKFYSGKMILQK